MCHHIQIDTEELAFEAIPNRALCGRSDARDWDTSVSS